MILGRTKLTRLQFEQQEFCRAHNAVYKVAGDLVNSGLALSTEGLLPINGLRHPLTLDTTGWYVWCGERFSEDDEFFKPVHTSHLYEKFPEVRRLLGLAPGWRFLVAGEYLDVWYDASLLEVHD